MRNHVFPLNSRNISELFLISFRHAGFETRRGIYYVIYLMDFVAGVPLAYQSFQNSECSMFKEKIDDAINKPRFCILY